MHTFFSTPLPFLILMLVLFSFGMIFDFLAVVSILTDDKPLIDVRKAAWQWFLVFWRIAIVTWLLFLLGWL